MMKSSVIVRLIRLYGIVQGVGFRPFVSRTAALYNITGDVANKGSYVEIHAKGEKEKFEKFLGVLNLAGYHAVRVFAHPPPHQSA